jgi:hypothetical protein
MRPHHVFFAVFLVLLLALIFSTAYKEGFEADKCDRNTTCTSCANASGCSWCPDSKSCLATTTLKSTDPKCNQMNTIRSAFSCQDDNTIQNASRASNQVLYDFTLYKNQITDKIPPPNVFTNNDMEYSNETVMAQTKHNNDELQRFQQGLPGFVATAVENQIHPMVKGILAKNYYIQQ